MGLLIRLWLFCFLSGALLSSMVVSIPLAVAFARGGSVVAQNIIMTILCSLVAALAVISIVLLARSYFIIAQRR